MRDASAVRVVVVVRLRSTDDDDSDNRRSEKYISVHPDILFRCGYGESLLKKNLEFVSEMNELFKGDFNREKFSLRGGGGKFVNDVDEAQRRRWREEKKKGARLFENGTQGNDGIKRYAPP